MAVSPPVVWAVWFARWRSRLARERGSEHLAGPRAHLMHELRLAQVLLAEAGPHGGCCPT
jgi:hypothetical protein